MVEGGGLGGSCSLLIFSKLGLPPKAGTAQKELGLDKKGFMQLCAHVHVIFPLPLESSSNLVNVTVLQA